MKSSLLIFGTMFYLQIFNAEDAQSEIDQLAGDNVHLSVSPDALV